MVTTSKLLFLVKRYALCIMKFNRKKSYLYIKREKQVSNHIYIDTITGCSKSQASLATVLRLRLRMTFTHMDTRRNFLTNFTTIPQCGAFELFW